MTHDLGSDDYEDDDGPDFLDELIAELYAVPRVGRPFWVAQQLEVALFEGLGHRVSATISPR